MSPNEQATLRATSLALATGLDGRVLLVPSSAIPGRWTLPGGSLRPGETPREGATRGMGEKVGLLPRLGDLLIVDWSTGPENLPGASYIFDGGHISAAAARRIQSLDGGSTAAFFATVEELPHYVTSADTRRIRTALSARGDGRAVYLEKGTVPRALAAMRSFGIVPGVHSGGARWGWHETPVPEDMPVRHIWVWVFAPDGRVVIYVDDNGLVGLPGGTPEEFEHHDLAATAVREVREETQLEITAPVYLGYFHDEPPGGKPMARVRMAATITAVGSAAVDPATGTVHRRLLVPPRLLAELCGWGRDGKRHTESAIQTARNMGVAEPASDAPVTEIPAEGGTL